MSENCEAGKFSLYHPAGIQVFFTVNGETDVARLLGNTNVAVALALETGYALTLAGVEPDERVEHIDGWVLGETSKDEPCIYLYRSTFPNKFKAGTVWAEEISALPIAYKSDAARWPGAAPEREMAIKKQWLQPCDFKVAFKNTGTEDDPKWRFQRVLGVVQKPVAQNGAAKTPVTPPVSAIKTNGKPPVVMTLALAESELSSDGKPYKELSNEELADRSIGIGKRLAKNGVTPDQKTEYQRKQDAIATILQHRRDTELAEALDEQAEKQEEWLSN